MRFALGSFFHSRHCQVRRKVWVLALAFNRLRGGKEAAQRLFEKQPFPAELGCRDYSLYRHATKRDRVKFQDISGFVQGECAQRFHDGLLVRPIQKQEPGFRLDLDQFIIQRGLEDAIRPDEFKPE